MNFDVEKGREQLRNLANGEEYTEIVLPPDPEPDEAVWYVGNDFLVRAMPSTMSVETIPAIEDYRALTERQQIAVRAAHMWLRRRT